MNSIHPKFEIYYKMSREFNEDGQIFNHEKASESEYYVPPRLFVRLEERKHMKSANELKGNILFFSVDGTSVTGRNGLAVTDKNSVQWWFKSDDAFIQNIVEEERPIDDPNANNVKER